jgi:hypothetical protein
MYKVTKKYAKGPETQVGVYKTVGEAKTVIQTKLAEDARQNIKTIYCLYEGFDLLEEFDQNKLETTAPKEDESTGASGQPGSGQRFSPTPFNMTPAPRGLPRSWAKDEEDKTGKK